ncbi:flavin monoamine oxidase family protein [Xanthobacteraceae bacterium A53D]
MTALTRRALLGGAFALPSFAHALGQVPSSGQVDVVIVGAGAAGIAAARRIATAGRSYALIEAGKRIGGRVHTETAAFGVPFDLGARRLHLPGGSALVDLAKTSGLDLVAAPRSARLYQGAKEAGDTAYEDFVATMRRAERAIGAAGDAGRDLPAARVLPPDLGAFGPLATFMLGPLRCAKELDQVSTVDFSRADEREEAVISRAGLGSVIAALAAGLNVRLETAATTVQFTARAMEVATNRGTLNARCVILAVPPSLITAGKIRVAPLLPTRYRSAVERITLGPRDHIGFLLPGNPLNARPDETVLIQGSGGRHLVLTARIGGSDVHVAEVGGKLGQTLADAGGTAGAAYVRAVLEAEFGADVARRMGKSVETRWSKDPLTLGGISCALPGSGNMRRALTEVVANRLMFAGEHAHETLWGTVAGAWASGDRAAGQALRILGVQGAALTP